MLIVLLERTERTMLDAINLDQTDVIHLHDVARKVEQEIGVGELSKDLRKIADKLHEMLKDNV
jgi:hypothetical protein